MMSRSGKERYGIFQFIGAADWFCFYESCGGHRKKKNCS